MAKLRRKYTMIDHENGGMREIGLHLVLNPAKNPADYAAMVTYAENCDPEMGADIKAFLAMIDEHPQRALGTYGVECLFYAKHPAVEKFVSIRKQTLTPREKKILKLKKLIEPSA